MNGTTKITHSGKEVFFYNIDYTIEQMTNKSVLRFCDGEVRIILGYKTATLFQEYTKDYLEDLFANHLK